MKLRYSSVCSIRSSNCAPANPVCFLLSNIPQTVSSVTNEKYNFSPFHFR